MFVNKIDESNLMKLWYSQNNKHEMIVSEYEK
jgi:hypothetical protein